MNVTQKNNEKGFTIIEVVLVLAIAALIFLLVFLAVPALQRNQRDTQRRADLGRVASQLQQWQSSNNGNTPANAADINRFLTQYMDNDNVAAGVQFPAPDGNNYTMAVSGLAATPTGNAIFYARNAECNGEMPRARAGVRNIAVWMDLEAGGTYCVDNT